MATENSHATGAVFSKPESRNGTGVAALTLGVVAVVFVFIPLFGVIIAGPAAPAALFCGLIGIACAEEGTATNKGMALAGVLLGLGSTIGVVVTIAAMIGPVW